MTAKSFDEWEKGPLAKSLAKVPERAEGFVSASGIPVERVYRSVSEDGELPGLPPYTRGVQPTMYRSRFWTMRQYAGFTSAKETNLRFRSLLEAGQMGLSVAFDLPTQIGYDSDADLADGEVGKVGVPIGSIEDMETLFAEIPLDKISVSMTINSSAAVLLALYVAVAKRRGIDVSKLRGTLQNDILKEYIARGTFRYPIRPSMRLVTDTFRYCSENMPRWNPISISGYHMREAGCTAVQELAFTFQDAIAYVESALTAGLKIETFAPRLSFFFACHSDFLEEIAKFRAARRLWAKIIRERFGCDDARSAACRFHVQTGGSTLTSQQPDVNVVRTALQALAAVLGGCQSLHTNSKDEALSLPSESAAILALRTQQVIAHESRVTNSVDPLGGSYMVESLTDELCARAEAMMAQIDEKGGMVAAIEEGFPQEQIRDAAYQVQLAIENAEQLVVGVNAFRMEEDAPSIFKVDGSAQVERAEVLAKFRASRDESAAKATLAALEAAAREDGAPLVERIIDAVEAHVTLGEIMGCMAEVFGEYSDADAY